MTVPRKRTEPAALHRWAQALAAWRIPDTVAQPVSPWVLPRQLFIRRADARLADVDAGISDPTRDAGLAALAGGGSVLDVGAAAGASSLPLAAAGQVSELTAVDTDAALLDELGERAARLGVRVRLVCGTWPEVDVPAADVVLCGNVLYNAPDLAAFCAALTAHARRTVVAESAARHPQTELNPLWQRFHGIDRPTGPSYLDCLAALAELGIRPAVRTWRRGPEAEYATFAETVDVVRTRLCLTQEHTAEVAAALRELGHDPALPPDLGSSGRELVTLTWPGTHP